MLRYSVPIILGAFLLFQIQPIMGKFVLPWFGGAPSVWTTCMLFFQVALLCGYAYAHGSVSRLKPRAQAALHLGLLLAGLVFLPAIPGESWKPAGPESAVWRIVALLTATVGVPFFLLSATGPLLQAWYSRERPGASPYRLYALSNAASLFALVSYPFLVEPALALKTQAGAWSAGYALYTLACGWCALRIWRNGHAQVPQQENGGRDAHLTAGETPAVQTADRALWVGFSACSSVLLLSTTSQMSQNIAVVPLLWVLPLALYLLTFVLCFADARWYWRPLWLTALPLAVLGALAAPYFNLATPPALLAAVYCGILFTGCMICHGELARLKPGTQRLTSYYLSLAAGGALGGAACSVVAPVVFSGLWEYQCGVEALCVLTLLALLRDVRAKPLYAWVVTCGVAAALGLAFIAEARSGQARTLETSRNFYGVLSVVERDSADGPRRSLVHGRITHGYQFSNETLRRAPVSYYGPSSGVGVAEGVLQSRCDESGARRALRTGAIGLGAGVMAVYGRAGDALRCYEINPDVVRLARERFSYLSDTPAQVDVVLGDARISLEQERARGEAQQFDLLVLDAFTGDAVPLHLLTRQAFELYDYHLRRDGVMLVHISSKYLEMAPLVFGLAQDIGAEAVLIEDVQDNSPRYETSRWVIVTRDEALLRSRPAIQNAARPPEESAWLRFSDDHCNLFQLLRRR